MMHYMVVYSRYIFDKFEKNQVDKNIYKQIKVPVFTQKSRYFLKHGEIISLYVWLREDYSIKIVL